MVWLRYELWENHDDPSYRLANKAETDRLKGVSPESHLRNIFYAPSPAAAEAQYCALRGIGPYIVNPTDSEEPFTMAQLESQLADFPDDERLARQPALPQAAGYAATAAHGHAPADAHREHHQEAASAHAVEHHDHADPHSHDDHGHAPAATVHAAAHHAPDHSHDHHEATLAHSVEHHDHADAHAHDDHGHAPVATAHEGAHHAPDHQEPVSAHPVEHHEHPDPHAHDDHGHEPAATVHADAYHAPDHSHDHHATPAPVASSPSHHEAEPAPPVAAPSAPAPKVTSAEIDALGPMTLAADASVQTSKRRKPNAFLGFLRLVVRLIMLAIVLGAVTVGVGIATGNLDAQTLLAQARELPTQVREQSVVRSLLP